MNHGNPQLGTHHCASDRGIDVPDDDDRVRSLSYANLLIGDHRSPRLLGMRAAAYLEMMRGLWKPEVAEKRVGHAGVIVLTGMDDLRHAPALLCEDVVKRRDFHEVRPRRRYQVDRF